MPFTCFTICYCNVTNIFALLKKQKQGPLLLTAWHSLQAKSLCEMLIERSVPVNYKDVAWHSPEVMLGDVTGKWPSGFGLIFLTPKRIWFLHVFAGSASHVWSSFIVWVCYCVPSCPLASASQGDKSNSPILCSSQRSFWNYPVPAEARRRPQYCGRARRNSAAGLPTRMFVLVGGWWAKVCWMGGVQFMSWLRRSLLRNRIFGRSLIRFFLRQIPNPEKIGYLTVWMIKRHFVGPRAETILNHSKMVETCWDSLWHAGSASLRLFYAVRSQKTAAAKALLEGGANLEAPGHWNGKRLPHARNTKSPVNRNMVGTGLINYEILNWYCDIVITLECNIIHFFPEWGDVLLLVKHKRSLLVFVPIKGCYKMAKGCWEHINSPSNTWSVKQSLESSLLSGHSQSSSIICN